MCQPVRAVLSPPPAPSKEAARPQLDAKPLSFIRVAARALEGVQASPAQMGDPPSLPGVPAWRRLCQALLAPAGEI